ncbi:GAF domain-containing sensor histidine kinase [Sulfitobacter albidus]|uniref:GAF domain-containing sensor histidine kinase n=1 Tax=Sulfitobacter albidus TaxID=2829501 RepID=UPI0020C8BC87|nr:GAF domain-containing sensor histidine kinase [Sulfitobacter albidus]
MRTHPIPFNEESRVRAVREVPGLTRENHAVFDAICEAAAALLECPIAHISVVEEATQWYKSVIGIELGEMPKNNSFCTHTIMSDAPMVVPDLSAEARFAEHPMVAAGGPQARFYAGVPLVLSSGFRFGSLCALDLAPHGAPDDRQMTVLRHLGDAVVAALEKPVPGPAAPPPSEAHRNFLTLVGHELRTPLTVMRGALQLIEARLDDPINTTLASSARKSTEHLTDLVETILRYSDVSTGDLSLHEGPVDMKALLERLYLAHVTSVDEVNKLLDRPECRLPEPLVVDEGHLRISITSLLLNAVLHGGDHIRIAAGLNTDGNVEITVHDNGAMAEGVEIDALYAPFSVAGGMSYGAAATAGWALACR